MDSVSYSNIDDTIVLFGGGRRCRRFLSLLNHRELNGNIIIFDNSDTICGSVIQGVKVFSTDILKDYRNCQWCITIKDTNTIDAIRLQMLSAGYNRSKELDFESLYWELQRRDVQIERRIRDFFVKPRIRRVLFCCPNGLILGGIEARTIMLCSSLVGTFKENVYILSNDVEPVIDIPENLRYKIIKTKVSSKSHDEMERLESVIDEILKMLPCIIVTCQPDIMLCAAYLIRLYKPDAIKIISVVSGMNDVIMNSYFKYGIFSDKYIGVSKDIGFELIRRGIPKKDVSTMTVPFPCDEMLSREWTNSPAERLRIGYAGRLDGLQGSQKRMDLVMQLCKILRDTGVDFVFSIAGDGPARRIMEDFYLSENMSESVIFLGTLRKIEMQDFWKRQDVAINMADFEGRSISTVEAMGAGAVPVVTDVSGVREDIIDGENGFIVSTGDVQSAADRIKYLDEHRNQLPCMGRKAHDTVWPKSRMEDHLSFWRKILDECAPLKGDEK